MTTTIKHSHGGARPGSGRKPRPLITLDIGSFQDPKAFLVALMNDAAADMRLRAEAAKTLLPFTHPKFTGKKAAQAAGASKAATKYKTTPAPLKLV